MTLDKRRALHEHTPTSAGGIVNPSMIELDHLGDQLNDGRGREELTALLPFAHSELAQEIFVDLPECVPFHIHRDGIERLEQRHQHVVIQTVIRLRQDVLEIIVRVSMDFDRFADI